MTHIIMMEGQHEEISQKYYIKNDYEQYTFNAYCN